MTTITDEMIDAAAMAYHNHPSTPEWTITGAMRNAIAPVDGDE